MAKQLISEINEKFAEYGIRNFATEGKGRHLYMAIPDDALTSARLAHVLGLKSYKYTVARVDVSEEGVEPADIVPDTWTDLLGAAGIYVIFTINPRRTKKARSTSPGKKKPTKTSAWLEYSKEERKVVAAEGTIAFGDVSKEVGRRWHLLTEEEKAVWEEKAQLVKAERQAEAAEAQPADSEPKAEKKKRVTGWILFSKEERPKVKTAFPEKDFGAVAKELSARWANLGDAGKEEWKVRAKEL